MSVPSSVRDLIAQLSPEAKAAQIKASNEAFKKLSGAKKRVLIAKDVLNQLGTGRIRARAGVYLRGEAKAEFERIPTDYGYDRIVVKADTEVQQLIQSMPSCTACALGSVFACAVSVADDLKVSELRNRPHSSTGAAGMQEAYMDMRGDEMYTYLERFFSKRQLSLIETAFERHPSGDFRDHYGEMPKVCKAAMKFGGRYPRADRERMSAIMRNIIRNKGMFKPPMSAVR